MSTDASNILKAKKDLILRIIANKKAINWPRELKMANKLFSLYPSLEFWKDFTLPDFITDCNSLSLLLGPFFKDQIRKDYNKFIFSTSKQEKVEHIEDITPTDYQPTSTKRVKSLKDFLK